MAPDATAGPLAGLRAVDLAGDAGVWIGGLLAELGAEVVRPATTAPAADDLASRYYRAGTRPLSIAPDDPAAIESVLTGADLLIDDGAGGWAAAAGPALDRARRERPDAIEIRVSPYGSTGPRAHWRATDLTTWAAGGALWLTGAPEREPLWAAGQARNLTGLWGTIAALAAVFRRQRTGAGAAIDLAAREAVIPEAGSGWLFDAYAGERTVRLGTETQFTCPCPIVRCRDGDVQTLVVIRRQWAALTAWLAETGEAEGLDDPLYHDISRRMAERTRLNDVLARWAAGWSKRDLFVEAQRRGIPFGVVQTIPEILADSQLAERGFWQPSEVAGTPIRAPGPHYRIAPNRPGDRPPGPSPAAPEGDDRPLAGVRVLDFTWVLAGPFATRILADLGADVVKIETRGAGDGARWNPPFAGHERGLNRGGLFNDLNHNKRDLSIDLKDPRGLAIARRLATEWADVVIENFAAGTLERLGLDPAELVAANPRLVVVRLSAFGQSGPYRDLLGYAPPLQALAGLTARTGYPPADLVGISLPIGDYVGGLSGALTTLAALIGRERTGTGAVIDISQFEGAVRLIGPDLLAAQLGGGATGLTGNRDPNHRFAPHGVYPARGDDRWIALAVTDAAAWQALVRLIGDPDWAADPTLATVAGRVAAADAIDARLAEWTRDRDAEPLVEALQAAGISAAIVAESGDLLRHDPQLAARNYFVTVDHPDCGPLTTGRLPFLIDDRPLPIRRPAPLLGEHNESVLREVLGLDDTAIDELILSEVI